MLSRVPLPWIVGAAAVVAGLAWWLTREGQARQAGAAAGGAAVDLVTGTFEGVVYGIGDAVGLPRPTASSCATARASGDWLQRSIHCPAGEFIGDAWGSVFGGDPAPAYTGGATGEW
jgi:hypothetical protein